MYNARYEIILNYTIIQNSIVQLSKIVTIIVLYQD